MRKQNSIIFWANFANIASSSTWKIMKRYKIYKQKKILERSCKWSRDSRADNNNTRRSFDSKSKFCDVNNDNSE